MASKSCSKEPIARPRPCGSRDAGQSHISLRSVAGSRFTRFRAFNDDRLAETGPLHSADRSSRSSCEILLPEFVVDPSIQRLQPGADLAGCDIGLLQQLAHGEEAMKLAGEMTVGHGHAG